LELERFIDLFTVRGVVGDRTLRILSMTKYVVKMCFI